MKKTPMTNSYNRFAAQSVERVAALSDGIFAVAMTLLVLELRVPKIENIHSEQELWLAMITLSPSMVTYLMSFLTLGIFWAGQQTQLNHFAASNRTLTWLQLGFLLAIGVMPFSTALLGGFITYRLALVVYWLNIFLGGLFLFISWQYATGAKLLKSAATEAVRAAIRRRIVIAQALYAFGALLCVFNTYISIGVIVLVQLNYVIAPRIRWLYDH